MAKQNKGDEVENNNGALKSVFMSAAERMQQQLGPSMCLAKWKQVSLHLPTGLNNSCYHPPLEPIPVTFLKENPGSLHNTPHKKQMRKLMQEGQRPGECQYCWNIEDTGNLSDRHYRSGEPWAAGHFTEIMNAPWDADTIPSYVEVNFNHACNLKCSYCSPQFSSSWQAEINEYGAYPTSIPHNAPEHFTGSRRPIPAREYNPFVEAFWEWWPTLYPELKHFRMTGGEPLMDKNTYRVFDYVLEHPKSDLHINVTSNFSVEPVLFEKYLDYVKRICNEGEKVEHFMQYVSLDGFGEQAEYMRNGLNFDRMWANVERFLTEVPYRSSLTFIITMNNLSITSLDKLLAAIYDLRQRYSKTYQRVWFDTPLLRQPSWQSIQILPPSYVLRMQQIVDYMKQHQETEQTRFKGFKDYEIQRMERDIAWMEKGSELLQDRVIINKADFYRFFNEHDKRRGTNFLGTFPEMQDWWNECKYHAET